MFIAIFPLFVYIFFAQLIYYSTLCLKCPVFTVFYSDFVKFFEFTFAFCLILILRLTFIFVKSAIDKEHPILYNI